MTKLPPCGFTWRDTTCTETGQHFCWARAIKAQDFIEQTCCHTKGRWARQPFILEDWQRDKIIWPMFGEAVWDEDWECYVRRYRISWLEIARKNGKSELLAAVALYLLMADDEEQAEVYGVAGTRDQAKIVFDVASRMCQLSPLLEKRVEIKPSAKRIIYPATASVYACLSADANTALGTNPSGILFDEVLVQPDGTLWDALQTGMGTRANPLLFAATTAGPDMKSFGYGEHRYSERCVEDADYDPRRLANIWGVPKEADPFDEEQWSKASPALGTFLSLTVYRDEARQAKQNPQKEASFKVFRCNQWGAGGGERLFGTAEWEMSASMVTEDELEDAEGYAGLVATSTSGMTAWVMVFPQRLEGVKFDGDTTEGEGYKVLARFWMPEAYVEADEPNRFLYEQWAQQGWLTLTPGDVIDYETIVADIGNDVARFTGLKEFAYAPWSSEQLRQAIEEMKPKYLKDSPDFGHKNQLTMTTMAGPTNEVLRALGLAVLHHGANPVLAWQATACAPKMDSEERVKPDPAKSSETICGIQALILAVGAATRERDAEVEPGIAFA